jgi:transcriptional regulator with XRE-family HTH domain
MGRDGGTMDFGAWVRSIRDQREMDVRAFAHLVGVDASTISRIEQARSQVTLSTAVRICEGVGMTPSDLFWALQGQRPKWTDGGDVTRESEVITINDLATWLSSLRRHWQEECAWLTSLLNRIAARSDNGGVTPSETALLIVPEDIEKLLQDSRLYQFKVRYPEDMKAEALWNIYTDGGALSLVDIGAYIRQARRTRRLTLSGLEESGKLSASVLSRLEAGALERVKLIDVLTLDEQLGQEGKIVAMYWRACRLIDAVARVHQQQEQAGVAMPASADRMEQDLKVIELLLTICRWLSCLSPADPAWVTEFHRRIHHAAMEVRAGMVEDCCNTHV